MGHFCPLSVKDSFDYIELLRDTGGIWVLGPLFANVYKANDSDARRDILEAKTIFPGFLSTVISAVELCSPRPWVLHSPLSRDCHWVCIYFLCVRW